MLNPQQRQLTVSAFAAALVAALCTLPAAAHAKPKGPDPRDVTTVQSSFSAIADSDEFLLAAKNRDWDTAKALMNGAGISPSSDFPLFVPPCLPPNYYLVMTLQWVYGPNPPPNGPVQWHAAWMPTCIKINQYVPHHFISVE